MQHIVQALNTGVQHFVSTSVFSNWSKKSVALLCLKLLKQVQQFNLHTLQSLD